VEKSVRELWAAGRPDKDGFVDAWLPLKVDMVPSGLFQFGGSVRFQLRWRGAAEVQTSLLGLARPLAETRIGLEAPRVCHAKGSIVYDRLSLSEAGGADDSPHAPMQVWRKYYEGDPLYDETGSQDAPPVKRVVAVHGVNVPTEIFYALRLASIRVDATQRQPVFVLDGEAKICLAASNGLRMSGGIASEIPGAGHCSGDGVVPLYSMNHVRKWARDVESLRVEHLDKAGHREMLCDARFHKIILDVATSPPNVA